MTMLDLPKGTKGLRNHGFASKKLQDSLPPMVWRPPQGVLEVLKIMLGRMKRHMKIMKTMGSTTSHVEMQSPTGFCQVILPKAGISTYLWESQVVLTR